MAHSTAPPVVRHGATQIPTRVVLGASRGGTAHLVSTAAVTSSRPGISLGPVTVKPVEPTGWRKAFRHGLLLLPLLPVVVLYLHLHSGVTTPSDGVLVGVWVLLLWGLGAVTMLQTIAGYAYTRLRPVTARDWWDLRPYDSAWTILHYRLMRVTAEEADRIGTLSPTTYRWTRQFEDLAGLRVGEPAFQRLRPETVADVLNQAGFARRPRTMIGARLGAWAKVLRPGATSLPPLRHLSREQARLTAIAVNLYDGPDALYLPFRFPMIVDAVQSTHLGARPEDALGWLLVQVSWARTGRRLPANAARAADFYQHSTEIPGWLYPLAGLASGEAKVGTSRATLWGMATLRAEPLHLFDVLAGRSVTTTAVPAPFPIRATS